MYSMMKRLKVTDLPTYYQHLLDLVSHNPDRKEFTSELKKLFSDVFYNLEIVSRDRKKLKIACPGKVFYAFEEGQARGEGQTASQRLEK